MRSRKNFFIATSVWWQPSCTPSIRRPCHYHLIAFNGEVMMNLPIVWALYIALKQNPSCRKSGARLEWRSALLCISHQATGSDCRAAGGMYVLLPAYRAQRHLPPATFCRAYHLLTTSYFLTLGLVALVLHPRASYATPTIGRSEITTSSTVPTDPVFWRLGSA